MLDGSKLNKNVPIPLYFQLKELILSEIKNGSYRNAELIPTDNELSEIFKISRTTVRHAETELVQEGWLYHIKSKGTFVSRPKINRDFVQTLESFNNQKQYSGRTAHTELLDFKVITAPTALIIALKLQHNDKVIYIYRRRFADEEPIVMVETYVPYDKCSFLLSHDLAKESLYQILAMYEETHIFKIHHLIEAVEASTNDIQNMNIKRGSAIQKCISMGYNLYGDPIEYSSARYRGDRNSFEIIIAPNIDFEEHPKQLDVEV